MWNEPYLETCCRATLHRLVLAGAIGRPDGLKDGPCLHRLEAMGLVRRRADSRFEITALGQDRHDREILKRTAP
ncbi:MAG TPA: hypothetical protein VMF62_21890 [Acetobacteraceae bacterium]|nr:hypothetical protein [Acetobacteraceae bacterium]